MNPHFRILDSDEIAPDYTFGWEIEAPVIEMHIYMPWLMERFESLGGDLRITKVGSLEELPGDLVVNCCGLGGKELCQDDDLEPVRGQIVYIEQDPGFGRFDQRPESLIYNSQTGCDCSGWNSAKGDWDETIREEGKNTYLANVVTLARAGRVENCGSGSGLRPSRKLVRLEIEKLASGKSVIHNYSRSEPIDPFLGMC